MSSSASKREPANPDALAWLQARIERLEAVEAIHTLRHTYARLADEKDAQGIASLFTPDGVWDGGDEFGYHEGRDEIRDFLAGIWRNAAWGGLAMHFTTNGLIEVAESGLEASGRWYVWEPATRNGGLTLLAGVYTDRYAKTAAGWLFSRATLRFEFREHVSSEPMRVRSS